jgi:signal transduction histidine kinase
LDTFCLLFLFLFLFLLLLFLLLLSIAHDFNNLLLAVQGHAELILLVHSLDPNDIVRSRAKTIVEASKRGAGLARQLLAFSGLNSTKTDVLQPLAELKRAMNITSGSLGTNINIVLAEDSVTPPPIEANRSMLNQILFNLIFNARDAIASNGYSSNSTSSSTNCGTITVSVLTTTMPAHSELHCVGSGAPLEGDTVIEFNVIDNGPGFSQDVSTVVCCIWYTNTFGICFLFIF